MSLPVVEIVLIRTAIATVALWILVSRLPAEARVVPAGMRRKYFATGLLIGIHWILFFLAVHVSNVSVCMVGMATVAFWSALLEPLMVKGRKFKLYELMLGLIVLRAIWVITDDEFAYLYGFLVALARCKNGLENSIRDAMELVRRDRQTGVV